MRTFIASGKYLVRLVSYLVAVGYPFHFDGSEVEFTSSKEFQERLINDDKKLVSLEWKEL
ncbi:hypothetical protein QUW47_13400 [Phocaeicola barnesiae]|jgi:RNase H-fold protein (predicted Holliday junction resolvase)|uniref:hypothetical protein n=1 Tax=Phocaeicola barnesiae TaxID=376804 RepID=UPI0025A3FBF9|nr:hypothetical protein [Phocaeicola barnesiae]MDM8242851.1 hypothetical protein [Phocaeicola barnesiae]